MVRRDDLLQVFKMYSATDQELDQEIQSTTSKEAKKIRHLRLFVVPF